MYKDAGFKVQEKSESHVNTTFAWPEHKKAIFPKILLDSIEEEYQRKGKESHKYITIEAEVLLLTAMQNIAQRGHSETEESVNKGKFLLLRPQSMTQW